MGKNNGQQASKAEVYAFHAAVYRAMKEEGRLTEVIPTRDWEGLLTRCLDTMTRQTCQDKTWAMDRLGLIQRIERQGVLILEPPQVPT